MSNLPPLDDGAEVICAVCGTAHGEPDPDDPNGTYRKYALPRFRRTQHHGNSSARLVSAPRLVPERTTNAPVLGPPSLEVMNQAPNIPTLGNHPVELLGLVDRHEQILRSFQYDVVEMLLQSSCQDQADDLLRYVPPNIPDHHAQNVYARHRHLLECQLSLLILFKRAMGAALEHQQDSFLDSLRRHDERTKELEAQLRDAQQEKDQMQEQVEALKAQWPSVDLQSTVASHIETMRSEYSRVKEELTSTKRQLAAANTRIRHLLETSNIALPTSSLNSKPPISPIGAASSKDLARSTHKATRKTAAAPHGASSPHTFLLPPATSRPEPKPPVSLQPDDSSWAYELTPAKVPAEPKIPVVVPASPRASCEDVPPVPMHDDINASAASVLVWRAHTDEVFTLPTQAQHPVLGNTDAVIANTRMYQMAAVNKRT